MVLVFCRGEKPSIKIVSRTVTDILVVCEIVRPTAVWRATLLAINAARIHYVAYKLVEKGAAILFPVFSPNIDCF